MIRRLRLFVLLLGSWALLVLTTSPGFASQLIFPEDSPLSGSSGARVEIEGTAALVGPVWGQSSDLTVRVYSHDGTGWEKVQEIQHPDGAGGGPFGSTFGMSGDLALIAGRGATTPADVGYLYRRSGDVYLLEQVLTRTDPASGSYAAWDVALDGDVAVASSPAARVVHVFRNLSGTWTEVQTLTRPGGFAASIALQGDELFVGAYINDPGRVYAFEWDGTAFVETQVIEPNFPTFEGHFGRRIDVAGDTLVVAGRVLGGRAPRVYSFERVGGVWVEDQVLTVAEGFGADVAISGDGLLVGSGSGQAGARSAVMYRRSQGPWRVESLIHPFTTLYSQFDPGSSPYFGSDVALDGDLALLMDVRWEDGGVRTRSVLAVDVSRVAQKLTPRSPSPGSGSIGTSLDLENDELFVGFGPDGVYSFERDALAWDESDPMPAANLGIGQSLSVSGPLALMSAPSDDEAGSKAGAAFAFQRGVGGWTRIQKLLPPGPTRYFSNSIALDGTHGLLACRQCAGAETSMGLVFAYDWDGSGFQYVQTLSAPTSLVGAFFGQSVAMQGDLAVIGADHDSGAQPRSGAAYVFRRIEGVWSYDAKLVDSNGSDGDEFGHAVDVDGDRVVVTAPGKDGTATNEGAVFVYRTNGSSWNLDTTVTANLNGPSPRLGLSLSLLGDSLLVGSLARPDEPEDSARRGAAHRFTLLPGGGARLERTYWPSDGTRLPLFGSAITQDESQVFITSRLESLVTGVNGVVYVFDVETPLPVELDIRPGSDVNVIPVRGDGVVPVAILGRDGFDATDVDLSTLAFGPAAAEPLHGRGGRPKDVDGDGLVDWLAHFRIRDAGLGVGDVEACITGQTRDGIEFEGCDAIVTIPACGLGYELTLVLSPLTWLHRRRKSTEVAAGRPGRHLR